MTDGMVNFPDNSGINFRSDASGMQWQVFGDADSVADKVTQQGDKSPTAIYAAAMAAGGEFTPCVN